MHQLGRISRMQADIALALAQTGLLAGYQIVQQKSDFPAPAAGVIQLLATTIYQVNGTVNLGTDRLVMGTGTIVMGVQNSHDILIYSGTAACISASGGDNLRVNDITILATLGAAFDAVDATIVNIQGVVGSALRVGKFDNCETVIGQQSSFVELESGIELVNTSPDSLFAWLNARLAQRSAGVGIMLNLGTSVWDSFQVTEVEFISAVGGTDIAGLAANANLTPTLGRGRFRGTIVNGLGSPLVGITVDDIQWSFNDNTGVVDSVTVGEMQLSGNSTVTDIVTVNVPVKVAGTTVLTTSKRFDAGATPISNNLRHIGLSPMTVSIQAQASIVKSGASKDYEVQIFKNGGAIGIPVPVEVGTKAVPVSARVVDAAATGDLFDLRLTNTTDADDATVPDFNMSVIGI